MLLSQPQSSSHKGLSVSPDHSPFSLLFPHPCSLTSVHNSRQGLLEEDYVCPLFCVLGALAGSLFQN